LCGYIAKDVFGNFINARKSRSVAGISSTLHLFDSESNHGMHCMLDDEITLLTLSQSLEKIETSLYKTLREAGGMLEVMKIDIKYHFLMGCLTVFLSGCSTGEGDQAKLIGVLPKTPGGTDYQAYYDPAANLTWLANANANGVMSWSDAKAWAAHLNVNGVTGWRLPRSPQPDPACNMQTSGLSRGFRCTGSEMGNLFYNVLDNPALLDLCGTTGDCTKIKKTLNNTGPFSNLQVDYYWTDREDPTDDESALYFDFRYGDQREVNKLYGMYAWAVHTGNVADTSPSSEKSPDPGS
jgi:hypothetical protein